MIDTRRMEIEASMTQGPYMWTTEGQELLDEIDSLGLIVTCLHRRLTEANVARETAEAACAAILKAAKLARGSMSRRAAARILALSSNYEGVPVETKSAQMAKARLYLDPVCDQPIPGQALLDRLAVLDRLPCDGDGKPLIPPTTAWGRYPDGVVYQVQVTCIDFLGGQWLARNWEGNGWCAPVNELHGSRKAAEAAKAPA